MTPQAFLRSPEAAQLCARAATAAGTPLSLHFVERNQENLRLQSWGGCAACRYVAETPDGKKACRTSRQVASGMALRQSRAMPFVCHMGFGCIAVPALPGEGFVLTFGPYSPAEASQTLALDALAGLAALGEEGHAAFPVPLDDIHRAPDGAINAVAEWLTDGLRALWEKVKAEKAAEAIAAHAPEEESTDRTYGTYRSNRSVPVGAAPYAAGIAAALAAGDQPGARASFAAALREANARGRNAAAFRRAHTVTAVAATLEAAERAGLPAADAWAAFEGLAAHLQGAAGEAECLDAAMDVLGIVRRRAAAKAAPKTSYAELNAILKERMHEGVTLDEVAALMRQTPSAISKRLIRKFGLNFSDYLGRLRMERAKDYLRRTQFTAAEIGRRVGIGDQSNFGKVFRKFEGMTPLEYRRRYGKKR